MLSWHNEEFLIGDHPRNERDGAAMAEGFVQASTTMRYSGHRVAGDIF
jgi:hypothetical protein